MKLVEGSILVLVYLGKGNLSGKYFYYTFDLAEKYINKLIKNGTSLEDILVLTNTGNLEIETETAVKIIIS